MAKFRVQAGQHIQRDSDGVSRTYSAGEECDSDRDLVALFGEEKFRLVSGSPVAPAQSNNRSDDGLLAKTVADLRELAEEEEIDLGDAKTKVDIIKAIRKERSAVPA